MLCGLLECHVTIYTACICVNQKDVVRWNDVVCVLCMSVYGIL